MSDKKQADGEIDPLALRKIYPNAGAVFSFQPEALGTILSSCLVVLDTNVLLVPFNTGKESLGKIKEIYSELAKEKRLIIPGQVAREFARLRPDKLKTVFQQLTRKRDKYSIDTAGYPLLESLTEYQEVVELEIKIDSQLAEYRQKLTRLLEAIQAWYWDDPVSLLYRELFNCNIIYDPEVEEKGFLADLNFRNNNNIPPGYKDAGKKNGGAGDLLIWNAVLQLGKERGAHVVFVSGDEKPDWWYQSEKQALYPRFELVEEFRQASNGKSLHIIRFAELLRLLGATPKIVREVQEGEATVNLELTRPRAEPRGLVAEKAVYLWLTQIYPSEQIESDQRGIDFIVVGPADRIGFEVKFAEIPKGIPSLIANTLVKLSDAVARLRLDWGYMVFASENSDTLDKLRDWLNLIPFNDPKLGVIAGRVRQDGMFQEMFRLEPYQREIFEI